MGLSPVSSSSPYHSHSDVLLVGLSVPLSTCRRNGAVVGFCVFISLTFVLVSSCPPRVFCDSQWIQMHLGLWLPLNTQTIGSIRDVFLPPLRIAHVLLNVVECLPTGQIRHKRAKRKDGTFFTCICVEQWFSTRASFPLRGHLSMSADC